MTVEWLIDEGRDAYSGLVRASGSGRHGRLIPAKAVTTDPAQVESLFEATEAPEALAMLSSYGTGVGLPHGDPDWSVSCLPQYSGFPGYRRAATFTIARDEVFYVWMELATGHVADWGMLLDDSSEHRLAEEVRLIGDFNRTAHTLFVTGQGYESFAALTRSEGLRAAATAAVQARRASGSKRQNAWHNSFLSATLNLEEPRTEASPEESADVDQIAAEPWDVKVAYYSYAARVRKHQSRFRSLLLKNTQPPVCAVCGLDVMEVLDAAHLVSDAEGGSASSDNSVLLCANHHRAMDSGLFTWADERPHWKPGAKEF